MKQSAFTIIISFIMFSSFAQVTTDTTFIQRNKSFGTAQSIYFDNNPNSSAYSKISDFSFSTFDKQTYQSSLANLKESNLVLSKQKSILPWTKWVLLKQYKGKYYVYKPCDFYAHRRASITDSCFIDWTGEGPQANKLIDQNKIDNKTFEINMTGSFNQKRRLLIHIIDNKKGIAVFEEKNGDEKPYCYLMIAAEKINSVPLIVNNCRFNKQSELEFDQPDFKRLIK